MNQQPFRVAIFNAYLRGGAANAARRMHTALNLLPNVESCFVHGESDDENPDATYQSFVPRPASWLARKGHRLTSKWRKRRIDADRLSIARRTPGLEMFSLNERRFPTPLDVARHNCDVLNLHWLGGDFVDYASFFRSLPVNLPIVWTLHDMNPFTGGCHFSTGCEAFVGQCGNCPQLPDAAARDLSFRGLEIKRRAVSNANLHVVTPSHWLNAEAQRSAVLCGARSFSTIRYGLDVDVFRPLDKQQARRELALPDEGVVVAFGAEVLENRRKGFSELLESLTLLDCQTPVIALVFGRGQASVWPERLAQTRMVGFVKDPARQRLVYSAADMFILPSLEDNLPQTGIEAMACGTPVVAFDTGGVRDYVLHHQTGLLAPTGDTAMLAAHISALADDPARREALGTAARQLILNEFDQIRQAEKYLELFQSLADGRRAPRAA